MTLRTLLRWARRSAPTRARLMNAIAISLIAAACSLVLFGGSGLLIGKAAGGGGLAALGALLIVIELVAFLRAPLRYEERLVTHQVALGSMVRWRTWLFDVLSLRLPGSLSTTASGDLLDRTLEDVTALDDIYVRIALPLLSAIITGLLGVVVSLVFAPLAGLALLCGLVLSFCAAAVLTKGVASQGAEEAYWRGAVTAAVVDLTDGLAELTMAGTLDTALDAVAHAERERAIRSRRAARRRACGALVTGLFAGGTIVGVTLLCASAHHQGSLTSAEVAGLSLLSIAAVEPLGGVILAFLRVPEVAASGDRLDELEAQSPAFTEPTKPRAWPEDTTLVLHHVAAPALAGGTDVLSDVDLEIAPGERVALLGASGAGKSTLCHLLLRFLTPTAGSITIGGCSLSDFSSDQVREHIALLDQSPQLFGGTLGDALRLGDPLASDAQLLDVLETVDLADFAEDGLEVRIAEAGASLSGGQQRRLALARLLLRRPQLFLLDEPTAGLDAEQADDVLRRCLASTAGASVLLLTHHVTQTEGFDRVYFLENGCVHLLDAATVAELQASAF